MIRTDVIVEIPVQTQDVSSTVQTVLNEDSGKRLELHGGIDEEVLILVFIQLIVEDTEYTVKDGLIIFKRKSRVKVAIGMISVNILMVLDLLTSARAES